MIADGGLAIMPYTFLRERRERIIEEWSALVASESREITLTKLALRDHLPALLDELAVWVEGAASPSKPDLRAVAAQHAAQRLDHSFQLGQLIHEFGLLRATILQILLEAEEVSQRGGTDHMTERVAQLARLNAGLDLAVTDAVESFVAKRDAELRDRMTSQLMQADRMVSVGTLAAGVAHEINNPLSYVISSLEFTEQALNELKPRLPGEDWEGVDRALADARNGAERVKQVVRGLKAFSRADGDRRDRIDLLPAIEGSISMASNEIKFRARLVRNYADAPPVLANEGQLGQVFLNLLINAAHAIPEGHVDQNEIRVVIRTDDRGRAVVEVRDSGSGISPELVGRVFDPFFTTKPVGVGTGLGLSICRSIISSLGGAIDVESKVTGGTVFRVTLPPAPAVAQEGPPPAAPMAKGRRVRILVVDDEPAIGEAIRRLLRSEHEIVVLTSATEARELVTRGDRFDAILCDLMMPGMTGMELHADLVRLAPDQAQRMIVLTGGVFTETAKEFLDSVPNLRVEKPFDAASLRAVVRRVVQ